MGKNVSYKRPPKNDRYFPYSYYPQPNAIGDAIAWGYQYINPGSRTETKTKKKKMDYEDGHRTASRINFTLSNGNKPVKSALRTSYVTYQDTYSLLLNSAIGQQEPTSLGQIGTIAQVLAVGASGTATKATTAKKLIDMLPTSMDPIAGVGEFTSPFYQSCVLKSGVIQFNIQNLGVNIVECQLLMLEAKKRVPAIQSGSSFNPETDALDVWQKSITANSNNTNQQTLASPTLVGNVGVPSLKMPGHLPTGYLDFRRQYKIHKVYNFELAGGSSQIISVNLKLNMVYDRQKERQVNDGSLGVGAFDPNANFAATSYKHVLKAGGFDFVLIHKGQIVAEADPSDKIYYSTARLGIIVERRFRLSAMKNKDAKYKWNLAQDGVINSAAAGKTVSNADGIIDVIFAT